MHSCIYEGRVRHRRYKPREHAFEYGMFMMYLDLEELPHLFNRFWFWSVSRLNIGYFDRRKHYGDPDTPLDISIRQLIQVQTGDYPVGPIRLLTHLRYFGYGFNPVSFYYCYDEEDKELEYIVAEVNNTPWDEQHCYVMDKHLNHGHGYNRRYKFDKQFHVSPFMDMKIHYDWFFSMPQNELVVHMRNLKDEVPVFDATMKMQAYAITSRTLSRALIRFPVITLKVVTAIYYQAFRLWLKKIPFHTHPDKKEALLSAKDQ